VHRKNENGKVVMLPPKLPDDVETVGVAEHQIHDDGVGRLNQQRVRDFDGILDLRTYPEIVFVIEKARQPIADDGMSIGNDDPPF
jgi:hypothetical protein